MTDKPDSLVERLNARKWRNGPAGARQCQSFVNPDGPEAAAALTAKDEQIARLRSALETIARGQYDGMEVTHMSARSIRNFARTALEQSNVE